MSNKTDMQTQLDRQAALIETLRGKAVGGGGGASVETCTLTVNNVSDYVTDLVIVTTTGLDGPYIQLRTEETFEIVKNSLVAIYREEWTAGLIGTEYSGDIEPILSFQTNEGVGVVVLYASGDCTFVMSGRAS